MHIWLVFVACTRTRLSRRMDGLDVWRNDWHGCQTVRLRKQIAILHHQTACLPDDWGHSLSESKRPRVCRARNLCGCRVWLPCVGVGLVFDCTQLPWKYKSPNCRWSHLRQFVRGFGMPRENNRTRNTKPYRLPIGLLVCGGVEEGRSLLSHGMSRCWHTAGHRIHDKDIIQRRRATEFRSGLIAYKFVHTHTHDNQTVDASV